MNKEFKTKATELGKIMNRKNKFSIPLVKSILECFEIVFTMEDMDYMLKMGDKAYTIPQLKELWKLDDNNFNRVFSSIRDKGGIWQSKGDGIYDIAPIFPGWIELFASGPKTEQRKQLLLKFGEFEDLLKTLNIGPVRAYMNHVNSKHMETEQGRMSAIVSHGTRKITINKTIDAMQAVYSTGEIMPILDKHADALAVMNCFCRMKKELEGEHCDYNFPMESCLSVGRMSEQLVEAGVARHVSYDEAVELINNLENKGCIHTLYHYGTDSDNEEMVICNCCVDCCFLYSSYREGALSQLLMKSFYKPEIIDESECTGCNKCNRFCPTGATWYDKKKSKLMFDFEKCIGCGQCVAQCPKYVRHMVRDERNVFVKTRKNPL